MGNLVYVVVLWDGRNGKRWDEMGYNMDSPYARGESDQMQR